MADDKKMLLDIDLNRSTGKFTAEIDVKKIGSHFASGVIDRVVMFAFWVMIGIIVVQGVAIATGWRPRDSTDGRYKFSNMRLRTDWGTGCQYLESHDGSLTPRLNADGNQVCGILEQVR